MYKELLAHSTLLDLPLVAMFLFLGVFIAVSIHTMMSKSEELSAIARLPLANEESSHE